MLKFLLLLQAVLLGILFAKSPYLMASSAVTDGVEWADGPMGLITTPMYETKKTDIFTTGASHMALLHNVVIRGFNSIYLQAPRIPKADHVDFIGYALTWHKFVVSHHDDEEENLFPKIAEMLGDDKIWKETLEEHESFMAGMTEFHRYLTTLPTPPTSFSGSHLTSIMDTFLTPFQHHFHHEITAIASLQNHPSAPVPNTPQDTAAAALFKTWGKATVGKAGKVDAVPFFLMNLDGTREEGLWKGWPPMPGAVKWGLVNLAGAWYGNWWRFASCDGAGNPRELYGMKFENKGEKEEEKEEGGLKKPEELK